MDSLTHPLTARLSPDSRAALMAWLLVYGLTHPGELRPDRAAALWRGNRGERLAAAVLHVHGLAPGPEIEFRSDSPIRLDTV
jgi:hypothetical protein